jgi:hypothetical protein
MQQRNIENDWRIAALGNGQPTSSDRNCEQGGGSDCGAKQCCPERRHILQDGLGYRPGRSPSYRDRDEEQNNRLTRQ